MWFGHGTAPGKLKEQASSSASAQGKDPILGLAFGAVAALAPAQRGRAEAQFQGGNLSRFRDAMTAWMRGVRMDSATFADRFFGRDYDDPVAQILHRAARDAGLAKSPAEFAQAARGVADAMKAVGLDRWARFIADAQSRARDPATVAAIDKSLRPPDPAHDAIRPVYPLETAIGIGAAGIAGGAGAALRAAGSAILRQVLPDSRPSGASTAGRSTGTPESTASSPPPETTPPPAGRPVRLHEGQQEKHIEGSNNFIPGRSTLTADPRALLERFAGKGRQVGKTPVGHAGSREAFDTGDQVIGVYRTQDARSASTTRGIIHYSNKGAHIVPAAPRKWQP
jgi:hypothetical protein